MVTKIILMWVWFSLGTVFAGNLDTRKILSDSYQYEGRGKYSEAIEVMSPLYRSSPEDYLVNLRFGWLFRLRGDFLNAQTHYKKAIVAASQAVEPRVGLLYLYANHLKWRDLESSGREFLAQYKGQYEAVDLVLQALAAQTKFNEALSLVEEQEKVFPIHPTLLKWKKYCFEKLGKPADAAKIAEKIGLIYP